MKNYKLQIANYKIIIPLLLLLLVAFGCQLSVETPAREGAGDMTIEIQLDPEDAPDSHRGTIAAPPPVAFLAKTFKSGLTGLDYWRAYHPNLTTGTTDPRFIYEDEDGELISCLGCHTAETSCNNCHSYVGVKLVSGEEDEEEEEEEE